MSHFEIEDNQTARLITDDFRLRNLVAKTLTFQLPSFRFTKAHKDRGWDGNLSFFKRSSNTLDVGLIDLALEKAREAGLDLSIVDKRPSSGIVLGTDDEIACILDGKTLRDYQVNAIRAIFDRTRGVIQSPTGSGKTVIGAGAVKIANRQGKKVLFLTHQKELLHQTHKAFVGCGIDSGMVGDSIRDLHHPTIIATVQTLYAGFEKRNKRGEVTKAANPEIMALLQSIDFIMIDEAHRGDAMSFQSVCKKCVNAYYRIGLTATPLMKGIFEDLALICQTGSVIYRITIKDLVDRGLLAQPYVKYHRINSPTGLTKLPYAKAYKTGITDNTHRNEAIISEAVSFAEAELTTLILVSKINHGKELLAMFNRYPGIRVQFIHGSKDTETRADALTALAEKRLDVLISSTITDEGVDIPAVSAVILAGGLKSPIKMFQRIGRGMRPKKGENWVLIVDFIDLTNKYLAQHSKDRFMLVRDEPGFEIVPNFDFLLKKASSRCAA